MKKYFLLTLTFFAFLLTSFVPSNTNDLNNNSDLSLLIKPIPIISNDWNVDTPKKDKTKKNKETNTASTNISSLMTYAAGTTDADLSVSLTGGATYNIPIATPPGIKGVNPNLSIAFNSQASNGLAGWGWNISGLSTINRVSSTLHHDGEINGVNFDANDRFTIDGERLMLKNGTYGSSDSEYQTENYSNIKVKAFGVSPYGTTYGPLYFIAYFPDGSMVWYGSSVYNSESRSRLEWSISKKQDPQGNFIEYEYTTDNELRTINKVSFGSRGNLAPPIEIEFNFKNRKRPELAFVAGYSFKRTKILDNVRVLGNGQLYRKYQFSHEETEFGYERVSSIQESNILNEALAPINFAYEDTAGEINDIVTGYNGTISPGYNAQSHIYLQGEFNGDGRLDFLFYNKFYRDRIYLYDDSFSAPTGSTQVANSYSVPLFKTAIVAKSLDSNNKLKTYQGITFIRENTNNTITFANYNKEVTSILTHNYTKTWNAPTYNTNIYSNCDPESVVQKVVPRTYTEGDFNGDGMTDVLAIGSYYTATSCYPGWNGDCQCNTTPIINNSVYFVNLDRNVTSNFATYSGTIVPYTANQNSQGSRRLVGDFNGNGKSDLFVFEFGIVRIYELDTNNQLVLIHEEFDNKIDLSKPILVGDYNGDGKSDFMVPAGEDTYYWRFFLSKGNSYHAYTKILPFRYKEAYEIVYPDEEVYVDSWRYIPYDYNADGKTDMIVNFSKSASSSGANNPFESFRAHTNIFEENDSTPSFAISSGFLASYTDVPSPENRISIFLDTNESNGNLELTTLAGNKIKSLEFTSNHRKDVSLIEIENNGITHEINYQCLEDPPYTPDQFYNGSLDQVYPYVNVNFATSLKLVEEVREIGASYTRTQNFLYRSAVAHAKGLGFIGFKQFKKTNWDGNGVSKMWHMSDHDPQKRGAKTREWTSFSPEENPGVYINKSDYTYYTELTPDNILINNISNVVSEDALSGITKSKTYIYDFYNNPITISNSFPGGSDTTSFQYSNNASVFNEQYHVGRLKFKSTTSILGSETFSIQQNYEYNNNLIVETKKKGNATPWVYEDYSYDLFGNVISKNLRADGIADRTEYYSYDTSGRYLRNSIDIEGLETSHTYNINTGNPLTTTNPHGLVTQYEYDNWQRVIKKTNYLGKETLYTYANANVNGLGGLIKTTNYDQGKDKKVFYDAFGWVAKEGSISLNNKWIYKSYEYDTAGRKIRESEPYFSTSSPTQWNDTSYDQYGRPISQQLYTGQVLTTTYNGLTVSVDDGINGTSKTADAIGNIISATDAGGTINYTYYANGNMKTTIYDGYTVSATIDGWGRKKTLSDPSAGNYSYSYNIFGEITKEVSPKGTTSYKYNDYGKVINKSIVGDQTKLSQNHIYDSTTKLLSSINGFDSINTEAYDYTYSYDSYARPNAISEITNYAKFDKNWTYDAYGRTLSESYVTNDLTTSTNSTVKIKNIYDNAGIHTEIREDGSNNLLWKVNSENAREQALNIALGNSITKTKQYDSYGFLTNITDEDTSTGGVQALKTDYSFNAQRGTLNSRKNYGFNNWDETFTHDNLDRLTAIGGPKSHSQGYDNKGRITNNSHIGDYSYISGNNYRLDEVDLNEQGDLYYQQHALQQITYNAFKKPVSIYEEDKGRVDFEYGPMMNRTHAYYGGLQTDKTERSFHKLYSSIIPVEIVENNETNNTKIITYIGGDAYTAPIAYIKQNGSSSIDEYHYLHRDYLGSILAITDENGGLKEERQFGAWGAIDKFENSDGFTTFNHSSLIGRGFTGHEHFFEVSLLHMNGRMYDAKLGRFLSPDNHIQNPYNTQSFNRYGYVWNNPLSLNDPSGEFIIPALIGAAISVITNGVINTVNGQGFFEGAGLAAITGFIGGAVAFEIGNVASALSPLMQAGAHGMLGLQMSVISGGDPFSGFLSGAFGSIMAGQAGKLLKNSSNFWRGAGMIGVGGLSGGVGSAISGGNFWDGVRNGLISSTLNHTFHNIASRINKKSWLYKKLGEYGIDIEFDKHVSDPEFDAETLVAELIEKFPELRDFLADVGGPNIDSSDLYGSNDYAMTVSGKLIQLYSKAFQNNFVLASTLFHEGIHVMQYNTGMRAGLITQYGGFNKAMGKYGTARAILEFQAYSYQIGVLGDTYLLNDKFYKRYEKIVNTRLIGN